MKITVAVPTIAGRSRYLGSCLATCIAQDVEELEILVSDNSDGDAHDVVAGLADKRIRYVRPPQYLPMSSHWEFVLQQATGDVITIIGDDDGLMPGCLNRVADAHREVGPVPIHHSLCNYFWPDYPRSADRNKVVFFHEPNHQSRWIDSRQYLAAIASGAARYVDGPMIYHNFIPLQVVRRVSAGGLFFRRAIPDVYSAVAIAAHTERFFSLGECLTISGQGARATGASVLSGGTDGRKFASEMHASSLFYPRFRSKTIQLTLLDAILEVDRQYPSSRLGETIDLRNHLWLALHEIAGMPSMRSRAAEISEVARVALKGGVLAGLATRVVRKVGDKLVRRVTPPATPFGASVAPMILDASVQGISDAARTVDAMLREGSLLTATPSAPRGD